MYIADYFLINTFHNDIKTPILHVTVREDPIRQCTAASTAFCTSRI